jgi:hypothetical protein
MSLVALEHERHSRADRLLQEITRRHGRTAAAIDDYPELDRFLVAFVPDANSTFAAAHSVEVSFTSSMSSALKVLRRWAEDADDSGAAAYIHDLDAGLV